MSAPRSLRSQKALPTAVTFTLKTPKCRKILTSVSTGGFTPKESENESDNHVERPKKRRIRRTDYSFSISKEFELTNELNDTNKSNGKTRRHLQLPGSPDFGTSSDGSIRVDGKRRTMNRSTKKINNIEESDSVTATYRKSAKEYDSINTLNDTSKKTRKSSMKKEKPAIELNLSNKSETGELRKRTRKSRNSGKIFEISNTLHITEDNKENVSMNQNSIYSSNSTIDDEISIQEKQSIASNKSETGELGKRTRKSRNSGKILEVGNTLNETENNKGNVSMNHNSIYSSNCIIDDEISIQEQQSIHSNKSETGEPRKRTRKSRNSGKILEIGNTLNETENNKGNVSMNQNSIYSSNSIIDDEISIQEQQSIHSNKSETEELRKRTRKSRNSGKILEIPKTIITSCVENGGESGITSSDSGTASEGAYHQFSHVSTNNTCEDDQEGYNIPENSNISATGKDQFLVNRVSRKSNRRTTIVSSESRIKNNKSKENMKKRMTITTHTPFKTRVSMRKRWSDGLKNNPKELAIRLNPLNNWSGEESLKRQTRSSIHDRSSSDAGKSSQVSSETEAQSLPENQSGVLGDTFETNKNNSKIRRSKSLSNNKKRSESLSSNGLNQKSMLNSFDTETIEDCTSDEQSVGRRRSSKVLRRTLEIDQTNVDIGEKEEMAINTFMDHDSVDGVENLSLSSPKTKRRTRSSGRLSRSLPEKIITMDQEKVVDNDNVESPGPSTLKNKRRSKSVVQSILVSYESEEVPKKKRNSTFEKKKSVRYSKLSNGGQNQSWIESENGTPDDCIIIEDDSKNESSQTLLSESLRYSKGKRRSKSLTFVPCTPVNGIIYSFNNRSADSSIESNDSSKKTSVRYHGTPHPLHKRRRTYELEESVTEPSILQALSESSSSQAAIDIQLNAPSSKKVRFEHVTMRRAQNSKKTDEEVKTVQLASSVTETSLSKSGKLKKSHSFHQKFLPSTSSTPHASNRPNLAKEVLTRNARITSEKLKRRSRSAEECGSRVNRTKMPDFAKLHKKAADKMENIMEMKERRAERARLLLSGQRPPPTKDTSSQEVVKKSHRQLMFDKPSVSVSSVREKQDKMATKQTSVVQNGPSLRIRKNLMEEKKLEPSKTSRFGFKVGTASSTDKNVQIKAIAQKTKLAKDTRAENRTVLKGVRGNRRFELLMKMRQK